MQQAEIALSAFVAEAFACPPDLAARIARLAADRRVEAGAVIVRQGDRHTETLLLVLGRVHAVVYGRDGQYVLMQEFAPGDLFGAVAEARAASEAEIVAVDDSRLAIFLALDFLRLVETHACVGLALTRMLMRQLRATSVRMVERTTLSAVGRIYAELLRLAEAADGRTIAPPPVLASLAQRVHSTRETVSRAVNDLERRGLVKRTDEALVIVAPRRLEELIV